MNSMRSERGDWSVTVSQPLPDGAFIQWTDGTETATLVPNSEPVYTEGLYGGWTYSLREVERQAAGGGPS